MMPFSTGTAIMPPDRDQHRVVCLGVAAWPLRHREAWQQAFAPADLFAADHKARHWRPHSLTKVRKGYGAWVHWCRGRADLQQALEASAPRELVTRQTVLAYVAHLEDMGASSSTLFNRVQELHDAIKTMVPDTDWSWLSQGFRNLRHRARPVRDKIGRLHDLPRLEALGASLMAKAVNAPARHYRRAEGVTPLQRALLYRDGLIIALLCRRPLRIHNHAALTLGESLHLDGAGANIAFDAAAMKGKRPLDVSFPAELLAALAHYLAHCRPVLLTASAKAPGLQTDALWISRDGTPLAEGSLHNAIRRRTAEAFGKPIPPHWFRDAAATFLAREAPEAARLTRSILGHTTCDVATRHYNQALMVDAARVYADLITGQLDATPPAGPS